MSTNISMSFFAFYLSKHANKLHIDCWKFHKIIIHFQVVSTFYKYINNKVLKISKILFLIFLHHKLSSHPSFLVFSSHTETIANLWGKKKVDDARLYFNNSLKYLCSQFFYTVFYHKNSFLKTTFLFISFIIEKCCERRNNYYYVWESWGDKNNMAWKTSTNVC